MRGSCVGNELSLAINGIEVETVQDQTFATGDVGLAVSSFESGIVDIRFDDFSVVTAQ